MIGESGFDGRGDSEALMDAAEIVVHVVNRDGGRVVFDLLRESGGQSREPAHAHADGEILPLDVASADEPWVRSPADNSGLGTRDTGRAVAPLPFVGLAVNLHEGGVVDVGTKGVLDGWQVDFQAVRRQLHPVRETGRHVLHELVGARRAGCAQVRDGFTMVFLATSGMRTVARTELPSTKAAITCARFLMLSLFMLTIY